MVEKTGRTEEVVRALFEHWTSGEDLTPYVAEDAVLVSAMAPGREYRGPEGARAYRRDADREGLEITPTVHDVFIKGERALVTGSILVKAGSTVDRLDLVWGCRLEDGKLAEGRAFMRRADAWQWFDPAGADDR